MNPECILAKVHIPSVVCVNIGQCRKGILHRWDDIASTTTATLSSASPTKRLPYLQPSISHHCFSDFQTVIDIMIIVPTSSLIAADPAQSYRTSFVPELTISK